MTTQVTIKAGGLYYPVRITKKRYDDQDNEMTIEDHLLAGGDSTDFYLPPTFTCQ